MKRIIFLSLILFLAVFACRKDEIGETTVVTDPFPTPTEFVKASIGGLVEDESHRPVADADVYLRTKDGDINTKTDRNGIFRFPENIVNAKGTYVRVERSGYFHGSRTTIVRPGSQNTVRIQLLAPLNRQYIYAIAGGTTDFGDFSITFPENGICAIDDTLNPYPGAVGVSAKWLNPTSNDFGLQMPGRLEGITSAGQVSGMTSMGMLAVELSDADAGTKNVRIRPGFKAKIKMAVPQALLSKAPQTIPLWYFDESSGIWREEGEAKLVNGNYEGEVAHFSFWNHDYKDPLVEIDFKVQDTNGNPVSGALVRTRLANSGMSGSGHTDNSGHIVGLVPQNQVLIAEVFLNPSTGCLSTPLITQNIGPFANNDSVCFILNLPQFFRYQITGTLLDCNGAPVANGYVRLQGRNEVYYTNANGEYSISLIDCALTPNVTLFGYDATNIKESGPNILTITPGPNTIPPITVCTALSEFFAANTPAGNYTNPEVSANISPDSSGTGGVYLQLTSSPINSSFTIQIPSVTNPLGTYSPEFMYIEGTLTGAILIYNCQGNGSTGGADCSGMQITITEYTGSGGFVAGTYSGILYANQTTPTTVSGSFRSKVK
jgi:protocatechuate 3,4-dioxygenase beta subunit